MPVSLNFNPQSETHSLNYTSPLHSCAGPCDLVTRIWEAVRDFFKSCFHCSGIFSTKEPLEVRDLRLISSDTEIHRRLKSQMRYAEQLRYND